MKKNLLSSAGAVTRVLFLCVGLILLLCVQVRAQNNKLDKMNKVSTTLNSTVPGTNAIAVSLRRLSSMYEGPLVRIQVGTNYYDVYPDGTADSTISASSPISNAFTSATAAINAIGANTLSSVLALNTNGYVYSWFDQSGNGRNMSGVGGLPQIISSGATTGAIITELGRPTILLNGTARFSNGSLVNDIAAASVAIVGKRSGQNQTFVDKNQTGGRGFTLGNWVTTIFGSPGQQVDNFASQWLNGNQIALPSGTNGSYSNEPVNSLSNLHVYSATTGVNGTNTLYLGGFNGNAGFTSVTGCVSEAIFFSTNALSVSVRQALEQDQFTYYNIAPVAGPISVAACSGQAFLRNIRGTLTTDLQNKINATTGISWQMGTNANVITNLPSSATANSISGVLTNTSAVAQVLTFTVTYSVSGQAYTTGSTATAGIFTQTMNVTVNPVASVASQTIPATCSANGFIFTPTGTIPTGTTYSWASPVTTLTGGQAKSIQNNISGILTNATATAATAVYAVTATSNGCNSQFAATITVNPYAATSGIQTIPATCSGAGFVFTPAGTIPANTQYSWPLPAITPGGALGNATTRSLQNNISGQLTNLTAIAASAVYTVTATTSAGCINTFTSTITVNPYAQISPQTIPATCSGGGFIFTPTGTIPSITRYSWNVPTTATLTGGIAQTNKTRMFGFLSNLTTTADAAVYAVTATAGGCVSTFTATITVNPKAQIAAQVMPAICSGSTFTFAPSGTIPSNTKYSWPAPAVTTVLGGLADNNQNEVSGSLTNVTLVASSAQYTVTATTADGCVSTFRGTIDVNPYASISSQILTPICTGGSFIFTPTNVPANTTYTWDVPISIAGSFNGGEGKSSQNSVFGTLTNLNTTPATAQYAITATTDLGCAKSFTSTINIESVLSVNTIQVANISPCFNVNAAVFSGQVTGGNGVYNYLWESSADRAVYGPAAGTNNTAAYAPLVLTTPTWFRRTVSSGQCASLVSNEILITPDKEFVIGTQPAATTIVPNNTTVNIFTAGSEGSSNYTYQWYATDAGKTTSTLISDNGSSATYTVPATQTIGTRYFYADITDATCGGTLSGNIASVQTLEKLTIDAQPLSQTVCNDIATNLTVVMKPTGGSTHFTYQWFKNADNAAPTGLEPIAGATHATLLTDATSLPGERYYYVVITDADYGNSITSQIATIETRSALGIVTNPRSPIAPLCNNTPATLTVSGGGADGIYSYQWYVSDADDIHDLSVVPISGANSGTYTMTGTQIPGSKYYFASVSSVGCGVALTSTTATIFTLDKLTLQLLVAPAAALCNGTAPGTALTADAFGGSSNYAYKWYTSDLPNDPDATLIASATLSSYAVPSTTTAGDKYYYVNVTDLGCGTAVTSTSVTVTTLAALTVLTNPASTVTPICNNTTTTLTVSGTGGTGAGAYRYEWFTGTSLADPSHQAISNTNASGYLVPATQTGGSRHYFATITDMGCGITTLVSSAPATVTTMDPLGFASVPAASYTRCADQLLNLTIQPKGGSAQYTYQWYKIVGAITNTAASIPGATGTTYSIVPNVSSGDIFYYITITDVACGTTATSTTTKVTTREAVAVSISQPTTVCNNTTTTFSLGATGGGNNYSYQWFSASSSTINVATDQLLVDSTGSQLIPPAITTPGIRYYYVKVIDLTCGTTVYSTVTSLFTQPVAAITQQPIVPAALCNGTSTVLTAKIGGSFANFYSIWYETTSATDYSVTNPVTSPQGANPTTSYTVPGTSNAGTRYYYALFIDNKCSPTKLSNIVAVITKPVLQIRDQPLSQSVCNNADVAISVTSEGAPISSTYQWYKSNTGINSGGIPIAGATLSSYLVQGVTAVGNRYYYVVITDVACSAVVTSTVATITTRDILKEVIIPVSQSICSGSGANLTVGVSGGLAGTYQYQWYTSGGTNNGGTPITGATGSLFTTPVTTPGLTSYFYATVTDAVCASMLSSTVARITNYSQLSVSSQPTPSQIILDNAVAVLNFTTTGGSPTLTYQWYESPDNNINNGQPITLAATATTYTVPVKGIPGSRYFFAIITDPGCSNAVPVYTNVAEVITVSSLRVGKQPLAQTVCNLTSVDITTAGALGSLSYTYQWYFISNAPGATGALIGGAISSTFTVPPFALTNDRSYYAVIMDAILGTSVTTDTIKVVTRSGSPVIIDLQPVVRTEICPTGLVDLTVHGTGGTLLADLKYQWYSNSTLSNSGGTLLPADTLPDFNKPRRTVGPHYFYATVTDRFCGSPVASQPVTVQVNAAPTISILPVSQVVCQNLAAASIIATVNGGAGSVTYQWYTNTVNDDITGASLGTGAQGLSYTPLTSAPDTSYYYLKAAFSANGCGVVTSSIHRAIVKYVPRQADMTITAVQDTICKGLVATLHVSISNNNLAVLNPVFEWYADAGFTIPLHHTGADFITPPLNTTITYYVKLSGDNICENLPGDGQSKIITVVQQAPEVIQPADLIYCAGLTTPTVVFASTLSSTSYTWSNSNTVIGLGAGGTDDIASFTTVNNSMFNDVATVSVTPYANGCTGVTKTFIIMVVPNAHVNDTALAVCSGSILAYTPGNVPAGKKYTWVVANLPTGINGALDNPVAQSSFVQTLTNTTDIIKQVVYIVTPDGCSDRSFTLTVTVNPVPQIVNQVADNAICSGTGFLFTPLPSAGIVPAGTLYTWSAPGYSPAGSITGGTSQNNPQATISDNVLNNGIPSVANAIYLVTPQSSAAMGGCAGSPFTLNVPVNPKPILVSTNAGTVCNNTQATFNPSSATSGVSFSWTRAVQANISNATASGTGGFSETLTNTGTAPVLVDYVYTITANGCSNTQTVQLIVQPDPVLNSPTQTSICSGTIFNYIPTSITNGVSFGWTRAVVAGIKNTANAGVSDVFEALVNTTNAPVTVVYRFKLTLDGCTRFQDVSVTVNPTPVVTEAIDQAVCNGTVLQIAFAGSPVANTTYEWTNTNTNIGLASSGKGNISFTSFNELSLAQTAAINVTPMANGCSGNAKSFNIVIYPTPDLSSTLTPPAVCSNTLFTYLPKSNTSAVSFSWSRAAVAGVNNLPASGTGNISETLVNASGSPLFVPYNFILSANGCTARRVVTVAVNPTPVVTNPDSQFVCNNTLHIVSFTGSAIAGTVYNWTNSNSSLGLAISGSGDIFFNAVNTTADALTGTIKVTPEANGCKGVSQTFPIVVNPTLTLKTTLTPAAVCSNSGFSYTGQATGTDPDATISWSRGAVFGISNKPASGTNRINDTLINTTSSPVTVTYVFTIKNKYCSNTQNVVVVVNPSISITNAVAGLTTCSNASFVFKPLFNANEIQYQWTRAAVPGISNPAASGTSAIDELLVNTTDAAIDVTYQYAVNANGACNNQEALTISVKPSPKLTSAKIYTSCSNAAIAYIPASNLAGTEFSWSRSAVSGIVNGASFGFGSITESLVNTTSAPITVTYVINLSGGNGCSGTDQVNVTVNPAPAVFVVADQAVCADNNTRPVIFGGNLTGMIYNWTNSDPSIGLPATGTGNIPSFLATNATAAPLTGYIQVTPELNGCKGNMVTVTRINVNPPIIGNSIENYPTIACAGQPVGPFVANYPSGGDGFSYAFQWLISADGVTYAAIPSVNAQNRRFTATAQTADNWYKIQITSGGCSTLSDSVKVVLGAIPVIKVSNRDNYTISVGNATQVFAEGASSYVWSPRINVSDPFIANPFLSPVTDNTKYIVTGTNNDGCSASDTISIHVVTGFAIQPTNVITPNGDGINDTWEIKNISYYSGGSTTNSNSVIIYNGNGTKVFEKENYTGGWGGTTFNGGKLATGTYYYVIRLKTSTGEVPFKGSLTILN
jgi:gliding motility-associated-like protein